VASFETDLRPALDDVRPSLDVVALGRWMDAAGLPGDGTEPAVTPISGGASNEVYRIDRGGVAMALRRPPAEVAEQRGPVMLREARVLAALADTPVPHPQLRAACKDPAVLGTPFYVMGLVDGWSAMTAGRRGPAPFDTDLEARAGLGREIVAGIASLATVDWRAHGLDGFGRPEGFHERQVERWLGQLETYRFRDIPGIDHAAQWLRTHSPRSWTAGIMHGDYSFANVMFCHDLPARLVAIVDWEMATVGDPLLDLGWLLLRWSDPGEDRSGYSFDLDGMFSRREAIEHYAALSGLPVDDIDYYSVLAAFKNAVVLEGGYARYVAGTARNPKMALFGDMVLDMAGKAAATARASRLPAR
jgi:aminoglycoside phosphotransferase (APT) family kinase protein